MRLLRDILAAIMYGAAIVIVIYCFIIFRLEHPELTETQLMIETWPGVLAAILLIFLGGFLASE